MSISSTPKTDLGQQDQELLAELKTHFESTTNTPIMRRSIQQSDQISKSVQHLLEDND